MANYEANPPEEGEAAATTTAVAIDRDKNSQHAVRWAVENLRLKTVVLVHVTTHQDSQHHDDSHHLAHLSEDQQLFLPYRGFCARKGVRTKEVILHDIDIAIALTEFININSIKNIVLGASKRNALTRAFKHEDVATSVGKFAPDFCSVYAVSKGKAHKIKSSTEPISPNTANLCIPNSLFSPDVSLCSPHLSREGSMRSPMSDLSSLENSEYQQSLPTERPIGSGAPSPLYSMNSSEFMHPFACDHKRHGTPLPTPPESAYTSFTSTAVTTRCNSLEDLFAAADGDGRLSAIQIQPSVDRAPPEHWPHFLMDQSSDHSELQSYASDMSYELLDEPRISDASRCSTASSVTAEMEDELKKMKLELKQITEKYNAACQEAVFAREKVRDIIHWSTDESGKIEVAHQTEEAALAIVEREKMKCRAAIDLAHKAQIVAELESEKRKQAEWKLKVESEEKQQVLGALGRSLVQYRRYTYEEIEIATNYFSVSDKIGEGSYGPVYRACIDHTPVAIKVLRSNLSDGFQQFNQEVEVLSTMRHPNMVILLGACPDYGCLVYEYMDHGCLEDRLFCKDGTPPLPWPTRFAIAAEIATALNFLHNTRPQPLVHRDLKPANILLDRNYISKISDVGLSRLVPPSVADNITQYRLTAAAGTFCYIDPEYQQTGLLGTKSDIYSFGIILLQLITARAPMGLTHRVKKAIEAGRFPEILDPAVEDWPVEEALSFAKLALKCSELRRRDRPSLDSEILPELERLRDVGARYRAMKRKLYHYGTKLEGSSSSRHQEISNSHGSRREICRQDY